MFSLAEKQFIAQKLEELLLGLKHPEMPTESLILGFAVWLNDNIDGFRL